MSSNGAGPNQLRLDHVIYASGPDGLDAACDKLGGALGRPASRGGVHPRFGTRNAVVPLADRTYIEIVDVLDHPAADKAPFGQAVKRKVAAGGGWLGWAVSVADLAPVERRLGRRAVRGNRHRPDGVELRWRQIGVNGLLNDPALPFFLQWDSRPDMHPAAGADDELRLERLTIAGSPDALAGWLDVPVEESLNKVGLSWIADGQPGIVAVHVRTPHGPTHL